jgi:hypothetical protein
MAPVPYIIAVRDQAAFPPGTRKTGLTLTWVFLKTIPALTNVSPQPAFTEVGQGQYMFLYDSEQYGDAVGQIDCGASLPNPQDRYVDVILMRDLGRIVGSLSPTGANLNLAQAVPAVNTGQTVGDALNAARAIGFGKSVIDENVIPATQTLFAADGVTVVRTFTLDDAEDPKART